MLVIAHGPISNGSNAFLIFPGHAGGHMKKRTQWCYHRVFRLAPDGGAQCLYGAILLPRLKAIEPAEEICGAPSLII